MKNFNIALDNALKYKQHDVARYAQIVRTDDNKFYIEFKLTGKKSATYKEIEFNKTFNLFKAVSEDETINYLDILGHVSPSDEFNVLESSGARIGMNFAEYLLQEPLSPYFVYDGYLNFSGPRLGLLDPSLFTNQKFVEMIKTREEVLFKKFLEKKLFKDYIDALVYKHRVKKTINILIKRASKNKQEETVETEQLFEEIDKKYPLD